MPELWRILPASGTSPILFTNRESLDNTLASCHLIAADRNAAPGRRAAARAVMQGQVQMVARVDWVDSE